MKKDNFNYEDEKYIRELNCEIFIFSVNSKNYLFHSLILKIKKEWNKTDLNSFVLKNEKNPFFFVFFFLIKL